MPTKGEASNKVGNRQQVSATVKSYLVNVELNSRIELDLDV